MIDNTFEENCMPENETKKPSLKWYFSIALILVISGIVVSAYLIFSHHRVYTDIDYKSFCAISKALNCDTVSQSKYALFFGVPVAAWGVFGYSFLLVLILFLFDVKNNRVKGFTLLVFSATAFCVASLVFGYISSFLIHAYCLMCIVTYAINFALLYLFWLIRRRFDKDDIIRSVKNDLYLLRNNIKVGFLTFTAFAFIAGSLVSFYPEYWKYTIENDSENVMHGITEDGHPWIGSEKPALTITEFTDYRCFQCRKMSIILRNLISKHPQKIRLIHRHFPMDSKFNPMVKEPMHQGSGMLSLIAIAAAELDLFWEANDYLYNYDFSSGAIYLKKIASDLNIDLNTLKELINKKKHVTSFYMISPMASATRLKAHRHISSKTKFILARFHRKFFSLFLNSSSDIDDN